MVSVEPLPAATGLGENATVAPASAGVEDAERVTLPANPFRAWVLTAKVAVWPWLTVAAAGEADRLNVGTGGPAASSARATFNRPLVTTRPCSEEITSTLFISAALSSA